ncbi:bacterial type III secretion family protein [Burkholderia pseudomallei MSHR1029]|nr:bacterial type III secretion family protein [Burkholderia pseudomallei MSHR1029]
MPAGSAPTAAARSPRSARSPTRGASASAASRYGDRSSQLSADDVAWEGWCLFEHERVWSPAGPMRIVRLALPREPARAPWLERAAADADGAMLLARVPSLFPEWTWLFG